MTGLLLVLSLALTSVSATAGVIPATLYGEAENGDDLWTFTDTSGNLDDASFFVNTVFGEFNTTDHAFGLYQYDIANNSMINQLQIFDTTTLDGLGSTSVNLDRTAQTVSTAFGSIDTSLAAGLGFGWYFTSDNFTAYSQQQFNVGNVDYFGLYTESDTFSPFNTHLYAMDNDSGRSLDYVKMSITDVRTGDVNLIGTTSVPEPTGLALFGLAAMGLVAARKKTKRN